MRYLISCFLFAASALGSEFTLSMCAIFQNEAPYIKEWIEYHKLQGVEHFWLYNNDSTDNWYEVLEPYVEEGTVELFYWPNLWPETLFPFGCQAKAYMDAIQRSKNRTKWLALIDLDEFIVPLIDESVVKSLEKNFARDVGVYIQWLNFGTSHVEKIQPSELMIEKLIMCAHVSHEHNQYFKSIVQPKYVKFCGNPHLCEYFHGTHRSDKQVHDNLRINHYWCRDEWFFNNIKLPRYDNWGANIEKVKIRAEQFNSEINLDIQRFVPSLTELYRNSSIH